MIRYDEISSDYGPDFEADVNRIVDGVEAAVRNSVAGEGAARAVRFAHAKSYGLLRASVEILDGLDEPYAQGVFASPGRHAALIRYSNGLGHLGADGMLGRGLGLALKLFNVPGESSTDEPWAGTMDYNLINHPVFFASTAKDYLVSAPLFDQLPDALRDPSRRSAFLHDLLTNAGSLPPDQWRWDNVFALLALAAKPFQNVLQSTFWSMGAVRHGDYVAKVRITPVQDSAARLTAHPMDPNHHPEIIRNALVAGAAEQDNHFELQVQLCTDLETMPVENTAVSWPEALSPFVTVARITVPRQDISSPQNLARAETLSFTPWRTPVEHHPLGEIQLVRRKVYERSSILRHSLNGHERREPADVTSAVGR